MKMTDKNTNSDDEDDLEKLRLAALQSLRKKSPPKFNNYTSTTTHFATSIKCKKRPGKGFLSHRNNRNTNGWIRNTNLISIPVIPLDEPAIGRDADGKSDDKFRRYDQSDESESDQESTPGLGNISKKKSTSIEALLTELDKEIGGATTTTNRKSPTPKESSQPISRPPPQPYIATFPPTFTMAPLSPRSAAFVMENRAIIEKRKRSKYSRTPSPPSIPRSRRSKTPPPPRKRRSITPPPPPPPKKTSIHDRLGDSTISIDPNISENKKSDLIQTQSVDSEKTETISETETEDDAIELEINDINLLSDVESDSDHNEGRFKTKKTETKLPVISYRKLIGETDENSIKKRSTDRKRSNKIETKIKRINEKKIEIKLKKSGKNERENLGNVKLKNTTKNDVRKVEIKSDEKIDNALINEGDLRAQLSRKRAERQKHPKIDGGVPSRLLQNALQGVVLKKKRKSDGKLPIHLRLGDNQSIQMDTPKKSRKSKIRSDQV